MASVADQRHDDLDMSRALRWLVARSEIDRALADYAHGIDGRDEALWLGAFHHDATYEVGFPHASVVGHAQILDWVREPWRFQTITHITGNHRVDMIDDTSATGLGRGVGIFKLEDGGVMLATAKLEDRYLKRNGAWKLSHRKVSIISSFLLDNVTDLILNGVGVGVEAALPERAGI